MTPIILDEVPGMAEALRAVQYIGGVLLPTQAAHQLVVAAWHAAEPAARAAAFADAADILTEYGHAFGGSGFEQAAQLLDHFSYEMRKTA